MVRKVIVPIVEGYGEVNAVPKLIYKFLQQYFQRYDIDVGVPQNSRGKKNLTTEGNLEKFIRVALTTEKNCAGILVLVDADTDCAVKLAQSFAERVQQQNIDVPVAVVCAVKEYEAWFLASWDSISASEEYRSKIDPSDYLDDPESLRDAKGWISKQFKSSLIYKETSDQEIMSRLLDFEAILEKSRSFRRLEKALVELITAIDNAENTVTPK